MSAKHGLAVFALRALAILLVSSVADRGLFAYLGPLYAVGMNWFCRGHAASGGT